MRFKTPDQPACRPTRAPKSPLAQVPNAAFIRRHDPQAVLVLSADAVYRMQRPDTTPTHPTMEQNDGR